MKRKIAKLLGGLYDKAIGVLERCRAHYLLDRMEHADHCHLGSRVRITHPANVKLGSHVWIGDDSLFMCDNAEIIIGNHVMLSPRVTIITGRHELLTVGAYMDSVTEKSAASDVPVIIEDDVWIATNVVILKGVTIGRGSLIGAGSIITKDVAPYSICYPETTPYRRSRFSEEEIDRHEREIQNRQSDERL